ncbi:NAD(P)H-binding protein [Williamsia sp.]|uniref:NAD(P)H-binding protein n=1 Tax=Williamsia sp. TaxID=1872085 RepID=UPI001A2FF9E8|nr:NAD(P)H-binding protein [Williamsia sp.]MBJ7289815.1 NAD(P)H-binding protein [Williamsia sp.]
MSPVLVLGSTGTVGRSVSALLAEEGLDARRATRSPQSAGQIRFDWFAPETWAPALADVSAVYLIAPVGAADPAVVVEPFLRAARDAGVRRVVVQSSSAVSAGDPGLGEIHTLAEQLIPEWTVLRPSWFMQNFTGSSSLAEGVRAGEIVTATGDGPVAFIDARDIAAVGVRALVDPIPRVGAYVVTGPQAVTYSQAAEVITRFTGAPVTHRSVTVDELAALHVEHGLPAEYAPILAALDLDIAAGSENRLTDVVEDVTGRAPRSFEDFVSEFLTAP